MRKLTDFSSCGNEKGIDCYFIPAAVAEAADAVIQAAETYERNCGCWYDPEVCHDCHEFHLCDAYFKYYREAAK